MKKAYLAAAALLGTALMAGEAKSAEIKTTKGDTFKFGFRAKVHAQWLGDRGSLDAGPDGAWGTADDVQDKSDIIFRVPNSRIYAKGSISKVFKWAFQGDFGGKTAGTFEIVDTFITLDFMKEFKVVAGAIKVPFELHSGIQSGWSFVMPTGAAYGLKYNPFSNPAEERIPGSGSRSPLVGIWGKVAGGMLKYYLYAVDGTDETDGTAKTGYGFRIELSPAMMGYSVHPGYVLKETYLGKKNILALGISYFTQEVDGFRDSNSFGVDILWEQKMGAITPNVSVGYVNHKEYRANCGATKCGDVTGWVVQGQVLFNNIKTPFGKPAVGARYAVSDPDDIVEGNETYRRDKSSVLGVVAQLYVKGVGNRIALSIDYVKDDNRNKAGQEDSWTDITLAFWYNF